MSDFYHFISQFGPNVQHRIMKIRFTALNVIPNISEKIHGNGPAFAIDDKDVMSYGVYKNYIVIQLAKDLVDYLKLHYPQFYYTKDAVQISNDEPFPDELIQQICELLKHDLAVNP